MQRHAPDEPDTDTVGELKDFRKLRKQAYDEDFKRAAAALAENQKRAAAVLAEKQKVQARLDAERDVVGPSVQGQPPVGGGLRPRAGGSADW